VQLTLLGGLKRLTVRIPIQGIPQTYRRVRNWLLIGVFNWFSRKAECWADYGFFWEQWCLFESPQWNRICCSVLNTTDRVDSTKRALTGNTVSSPVFARYRPMTEHNTLQTLEQEEFRWHSVSDAQQEQDSFIKQAFWKT